MPLSSKRKQPESPDVIRIRREPTPKELEQLEAAIRRASPVLIYDPEGHSIEVVHEGPSRSFVVFAIVLSSTVGFWFGFLLRAWLWD